jgi:hypothetical protein
MTLTHSTPVLASTACLPHVRVPCAASEKKLPPNMKTRDPKAPDRFNSSVKVRNYETVRVPYVDPMWQPSGLVQNPYCLLPNASFSLRREPAVEARPAAAVLLAVRILVCSECRLLFALVTLGSCDVPCAPVLLLCYSCATPVLLLCYSCARVPLQVHLPEYKGWHNREPTPLNAAWTWKPEPGNGLPVNPKTRVSRGPNYRVSENCGFAWDPGASYGPETIAALPTADDKLKEDLFDETQDQATDGVPDTGIFAFGSTANKRNNS